MWRRNVASDYGVRIAGILTYLLRTELRTSRGEAQMELRQRIWLPFNDRCGILKRLKTVGIHRPQLSRGGRLMARGERFSRGTKLMALSRQGWKCALCGTQISLLGKGGRVTHKFGEGSQAHHVRHVKLGGSNMVENCVVICDSCHYSVHEGGNYRWGKVIGGRSDFPFYRRSRRKR